MNRSQALYTSIGLQLSSFTILVFARESYAKLAAQPVGKQPDMKNLPPLRLLHGSDYADGGKDKGRTRSDFAAIGIALSYRIPKTAPEPSVFSIWSDRFKKKIAFQG